MLCRRQTEEQLGTCGQEGMLDIPGQGVCMYKVYSMSVAHVYTLEDTEFCVKAAATHNLVRPWLHLQCT